MTFSRSDGRAPSEQGCPPIAIHEEPPISHPRTPVTSLAITPARLGSFLPQKPAMAVALGRIAVVESSPGESQNGG